MALNVAADDLLEGDHVEAARENAPEAETRLWQAVVLRAWLDAFEASDFFLRCTEGKSGNLTFDPDLIRFEARRWLVSGLDPWKNDREEVCDNADLDASLIQEAARKRMEAINAEDAVSARSIDSAFLELVSASETLPEEIITAKLEELAVLESTAA